MSCPLPLTIKLCQNNYAIAHSCGVQKIFHANAHISSNINLFNLIAVHSFYCAWSIFVKVDLNLVGNPAYSKQETCRNFLNFLKTSLFLLEYTCYSHTNDIHDPHGHVLKL